MSDIRSLGWIRIQATDVDKWRELTVDCLGLAAAKGPNPDGLYLRIDERPHRLAILPGDVDTVLAVGWEVRDQYALARVKQAVADAGIEVRDIEGDELAALKVEAAIGFADPSGTQLEVFFGPALDHRPVVSSLGTRFVTADQGMGHVVIPTVKADETCAFYEQTLGFLPRGAMSMGPMGRIRFLGVNPRHHSLAIVPGLHTDPPGLVHLMVEAEQLDEVGRALDKVAKKGFLVSSSIGRHTNDKMISFYVRSPGGFDIEFGCEGMRVDETYYTAEEITRDSYWGHDWTSDPPSWLVPMADRSK